MEKKVRLARAFMLEGVFACVGHVISLLPERARSARTPCGLCTIALHVAIGSPLVCSGKYRETKF